MFSTVQSLRTVFVVLAVPLLRNPVPVLRP